MKMSRIVSVFLLISLVFALGACRKEPAHPHHVYSVGEVNYHAYVVQFPDESKIEITTWQKEPFIDENAKRTIEKWIDGIWIPGTYRHSVRDFPNNFDTRIYYDDRNLQFGVDKDGKLIFYFWGNESGGEKICSEQECLEIGKKFVMLYQDISGYQLKTEKKESTGLYTFTFTKYAGGYPTLDQAIVTVHESGKLYSYSSFMLGKIPDQVAGFDKDKLLKVITEKLDALYAEAKQQEDFTIVYSKPEIFYRTSGQLYCVIDVEHQYTHEGLSCSFTEQIGLLVDI